MGKLDGRVAFVTGAGRGIGAASALRLAEDGAKVILADIDLEGCKQVAAEIDIGKNHLRTIFGQAQGGSEIGRASCRERV